MVRDMLAIISGAYSKTSLQSNPNVRMEIIAASAITLIAVALA
jgi:hypothetical protein